MKDWKEIEKKIGYRFQDSSLLQMALRHSSYTNEHRMNRLDCNERLEFLGDAVLELASSEFLFQNDPKMPEGELTRLRASLVCEPTLALCARQLDLGAYLSMGKGEELTGGRGRDSIVSDALEALIGAIYLDGGFANAKEFIQRFVLNDIEHKKLFFDSKTIFQEMVQGNLPGEISYRLVGEEGPDHNKTFLAQVWVGEVCFGQGKGHSKKAAEQAAAYHAICKMKRQDGDVCI
ncbi:MAG TPA: ribonuclease III [Candidatus Pullilachnospira intestinigallinarum]|nr:ribonuclease III [Candidatus Pullilachnospira intestinigallinarum]